MENQYNCKECYLIYSSYYGVNSFNPSWTCVNYFYLSKYQYLECWSGNFRLSYFDFNLYGWTVRTPAARWTATTSTVSTSTKTNAAWTTPVTITSTIASPVGPSLKSRLRVSPHLLLNGRGGVVEEKVSASSLPNLRQTSFKGPYYHFLEMLP